MAPHLIIQNSNFQFALAILMTLCIWAILLVPLRARPPRDSCNCTVEWSSSATRPYLDTSTISSTPEPTTSSTSTTPAPTTTTSTTPPPAPYISDNAVCWTIADPPANFPDQQDGWCYLTAQARNAEYPGFGGHSGRVHQPATARRHHLVCRHICPPAGRPRTRVLPLEEVPTERPSRQTGPSHGQNETDGDAGLGSA